jgi:RNA polymerase primary sigma factor
MNYTRPLPHDIQLDLWRQAKAGDLPSRNKLVMTSMRYVVRRATYFASKTKGSDLEDLTQAGSLGIIKAVDHYKEGLGTTFSTYAAWWIDQAIRDECNEVRELSKGDARRYHWYKRWLTYTERFSLSSSEAYSAVASDFKAHEWAVRKVVAEHQRTRNQSLQTLAGDSDHETLQDMLPANDVDLDGDMDHVAWLRKLKFALRGFAKCLCPVDWAIYTLRLIVDREDRRSLAEIALHHNLSRERVRQREVKLKKKIRVYLSIPAHRSILADKGYQREHCSA